MLAVTIIIIISFVSFMVLVFACTNNSYIFSTLCRTIDLYLEQLINLHTQLFELIHYLQMSFPLFPMHVSISPILTTCTHIHTYIHTCMHTDRSIYQACIGISQHNLVFDCRSSSHTQYARMHVVVVISDIV